MTKVKIGKLLAGTSLMAAGWYNTVRARKSYLGLMCLIVSGMLLDGSVEYEKKTVVHGAS